MGVYQVMPLSEELKRMVMEGRNAMEIGDQALREGVPDLRMSAVKKVKDGHIDIKEMNRVTVE
jgi:type IV pilus assembly protein PilB